MIVVRDSPGCVLSKFHPMLGESCHTQPKLGFDILDGWIQHSTLPPLSVRGTKKSRSGVGLGTTINPNLGVGAVCKTRTWIVDVQFVESLGLPPANALGIAKSLFEQQRSLQTLHRCAIIVLMREPVWTDSTRRCSRCGVHKPFSEFAINKRFTGGINGWCKTCAAAAKIYGEANLSVEEITAFMNSNKFWDWVAVTEGPLDTPCIVWTRGNERYPRKYFRYHVTYVHRLALVSKLGRHIKPGMAASHLCHNKRCVNQNHLVEETHGENMARSYSKKPGKKKVV